MVVAVVSVETVVVGAELVVVVVVLVEVEVVVEVVVVGEAVVGPPPDPAEHFSDLSPTAAMANLFSVIIRDASAFPSTPVGTFLNLT